MSLNIIFDSLFFFKRGSCEETASSLFFSLDLVKGVHARASVERRSCETRDARNEGGSLSRRRTFSHARGHLRVSGVLLDGPRKKRDCS